MMVKTKYLPIDYLACEYKFKRKMKDFKKIFRREISIKIRPS